MASSKPGRPQPEGADRVVMRLQCRNCPHEAGARRSGHAKVVHGYDVTALVGTEGPMEGKVAGFEVSCNPVDAEHALRALQELVFDWCDRQKEPVPLAEWQASHTGFVESTARTRRMEPPAASKSGASTESAD
jgi:hypothetical protein